MKQRIYIEYYDNGNLHREVHYLGDKEATKDTIRRFKWHRTDGPAYIWYNENGKKEDDAWYVDDKYLNEEEIEKMKIMIELNKEIIK